MSGHHHERFDRSEVPLPSDRSVGFNFAVVALVIAYFWRTDHSISRAAVIMAAALVGAGILAPAVLRPLNIAWFKFGQVLHRCVSPVVMLAIFIIRVLRPHRLSSVTRIASISRARASRRTLARSGVGT